MIDYSAAKLFRVVTPSAVCGVFIDGDRIVEVAPYFVKAARLAGFSWLRFVSRLGPITSVERVP